MTCRKMKIVSTDVVGGRCIGGNDGTLCLMEKDRENSVKHICQK